MPHTIPLKALEWERSKRDKSYLLRGNSLEGAVEFLSQTKLKEPSVTTLQMQYVAESHKQQRVVRRQLMLAIGMFVFFIAIIASRRAGIP